jgi:hypothetical protein
MRCQWHCMHFKFFCIPSLFCIWFFCACGVNDTTCTMHAVLMPPHAHMYAVSMIPHAPCMGYQWHCMHHACGINDTVCILKNSNICANSNLYSKRFEPLNQEPRTDVLMKKSEGRKSCDTVPLNDSYRIRVMGSDEWKVSCISMEISLASSIFLSLYNFYSWLDRICSLFSQWHLLRKF